jgi:tetratricopeptide (TPR) repeat protein
MEDVFSLTNKMNGFYKMKLHDKAIDYADKIISIDNNNPMPYYIKGLIFHNEGKYAEAIDQFKAMADLDPGNVMPWYMLAECYKALKKKNEAESYIDEILKIDPHDIKAMKEKAKLAFENGNKELSLEFCYKVLEIDEDVEMQNLKRKIKES